ncbi:MAG: hypothetical protein PUC06_07110 [Oscillospiraceae bacterium]|nr:hypothetical protein [Oscillospiraceae bacterium]
MIFGLLLLAAMMIGGALLIVQMPVIRILWENARLKARTMEQLPFTAAAQDAVLLDDRICLTSDGEVTVLEPDGTLLYQVSSGEKDLSLAGGGRIAAFYASGGDNLTILGENGPISVAVGVPVIRAAGNGSLLAVQVKRSGCLSDTILMNGLGETTGEIRLRDAVMGLMIPGADMDGLSCACVGTNGRWDIRMYQQDGTLLFRTPADDPVLELIPVGENVFARTSREILRLDGQGNILSRLPSGENDRFCGNEAGQTALLQQNGGERLLRLFGTDGNEVFSRSVSGEVFDLKLTDHFAILRSVRACEIYDAQGRLVRKIPCNGCESELLISENRLCLLEMDGIVTMKLKETVPGLYG